MTDSRRSGPGSDQDSDSQVFPLSTPTDSQDSSQELPASSTIQSTTLQEDQIGQATQEPCPPHENEKSPSEIVAPSPNSLLDSKDSDPPRSSDSPTDPVELDSKDIAASDPIEAKKLDADETTPLEEDVAPPPPQSFEELGLPTSLIKSVEALNWQQPTPVQAATYRQLADGVDLLVQSQTGTGKTGAFCLPWLAKRFVASNAKDTGVQLLVLVPTRELAKQVSQELVSLAKNSNLIVSAIYGGTPMLPQLDQLKQGIHAVIGTPGRILDHIRRRSLDLSKIATVILDECDEMLSMGFLEDIKTILDSCPQSRQTCLFSATIPDDISRIANRYLKSPEKIELSSDRISATQIEHAYYVASSSVKTRDLIDVIVVEVPSFAIIFCNTREETRVVASVLQKEGFAAEALSSDLAQSARERVLSKMRSHKLRFLVATDIAARGIDISHVSHVINFSFPSSAETYVHRTGRTGRAGRAGQAISLVGPQEIGDFNLITKHYPDLIFNQRFLPASDELASTRKEEKLDALSRKYSIPVSPEWVQLARHLVSDPRSDRIVAYLLSKISQIQMEAESSFDAASSTIEADSTADRSSSRPPRRGRRGSRTEDGRKRSRHSSTRSRDDRKHYPREGDLGESERSDALSSLDEAEIRGDQDSSIENFSTSEDSRRNRRVAGDSRRRRDSRRRSRRTGSSRGLSESRELPSESSQAGAADNFDNSAMESEELTVRDDAPDSPDLENESQFSSKASRDDAGSPKSRNRRRRRRGRERGKDFEAEHDPSAVDSSTDSGPPSHEHEGDDVQIHSGSATAELDSNAERSSSMERGRRRPRNHRRKRSRRSENASESFGPLDREQPRSADSQSKIVIEIDDSELEIVRSEFGEFDELSELTVKGRRRAFLDELKDRDDVAIEDLSQLDAQEDVDEEPIGEGPVDASPEQSAERTGESPHSTEALGNTNDSSFVASSPRSSTATIADSEPAPGQAEYPSENKEHESNESTEAAIQSASTAGPQKKRRRRRRSKRTAPPVTPEITAPPHKDFWEVWSTRFSLQDFVKEEDEFGDVQHAELSRNSARNESNARDHRHDRNRSASGRTKPSSDFERSNDHFQSASKGPVESVRIRLNIGRRQGFKSADIRALLQDKCNLAGRDIRDLTVRTTSTFFQVSKDSDAINQLHGTHVGDVILEATVAEDSNANNEGVQSSPSSPAAPEIAPSSATEEASTEVAEEESTHQPDTFSDQKPVHELSADQSSLNFDLDLDVEASGKSVFSKSQTDEVAEQRDTSLDEGPGTETGTGAEPPVLTPSEADVP